MENNSKNQQLFTFTTEEKRDEAPQTRTENIDDVQTTTQNIPQQVHDENDDTKCDFFFCAPMWCKSYASEKSCCLLSLGVLSRR